MDSGNITRRLVVGVLGGGVIAAPVVAHAFTNEEGSAQAPSSAMGGTRAAASILQPLTAGTKVGRWVVAGISPLQNGAIEVGLRSEEALDHVFHVEVLARDSSALAARPPAETRHFALFVRNGGDGWMPTEEDQGLAAMTLAKVIESNERDLDASGFLTLADRLKKAH